MATQAFVYTELHHSIPFDRAPWRKLNPVIRQQPGFISKTWLSGVDNASVGGFFVFDSVENAEKFVTGYFPQEVATFDVAHTTRIFDGDVVQEASREMGSVHFGGRLPSPPGAFVYTEVQLSVPFDEAPWRELNPVLKQQRGILAKTWLSGLHTRTPGGLYAFDSVENARRFAVDYFPTEARKLNAAFTTKIFDASVVEAASRELESPFFV